MQKKISISEEILHYGEYLIDNFFDTNIGCYRIRIILFEGKLFYHKMKNGEVVEVHNLDKMREEIKK